MFVYTPLKRISRWSTLIGSVPGAIPPMIGWSAATGQVDDVGATLFGILVAWQMPHFLAIGRLYREDYRRAGMVMLGVRRGDADAAYRHMVAWCAVLVPVSAGLTVLGATGNVYLVGAMLLGAGFLATAASAARQRSRAADRRAFLYSLVYLPILMLLMLADRLLA